MGFGAIFLCQYTSLWYAVCQWRRGVYSAFILITSYFLFSRLQIRAGSNFFQNFAVLSSRATASGCYIDFSGFSTSRVCFAQELILYTTYVTVGTSGTFKTKIKQGSIHGADI
jgi:hypothetical protein